jgi:hypothetical protein
VYPVLSILRRAASKVVYVHPEKLGKHPSGTLFLCQESPGTFLDVPTRTWERSAEVPFFLLQVRGSTPAATATALTQFENQLSLDAKLEGKTYTLFLGEELEIREGKKLVRSVPVAVLRGLHRMARPLTPPKRREMGFRKLPRGAVEERH